jgi:hypothetical protein
MAVVAIPRMPDITPAPRQRVPEVSAPAMVDDQASSPQEFLAARGLLGWVDSDEGRHYLLHVCMNGPRAA